MKDISVIMSNPMNHRIFKLNIFFVLCTKKNRKTTEFKRKPGFGVLTLPFMGWNDFQVPTSLGATVSSSVISISHNSRAIKCDNIMQILR